jgi:hypothetical protein
MELKEKFGFNRAFQDKVLSLLMSNKMILGGHIDLLEPSHFDGIERINLAEILFDYYKKYHEVPSVDSVCELIRTGDFKKEAKDSLLSFFLDKIVSQTKIVAVEREFIGGKLTEFAKYQSVVGALIQSKKLIENNNLDEVQELMAKAFLVGGTTDIGTFYFDTVKDRVERRREAREDKNELVVPTLIKGIDTRIDGGLRAGELGVFVAGPSVGKSMALIHACKAAVMQGFAAIYYSMELYLDRLEDRFDASFSGIPTKDLHKYPEDVRKQIRSLWDSCGGDLLLQYYPARTVSVQTIEAHLMRLVEEHNFFPQLICVDYADLLKGVIPRKDRYEEVGEAYVDLRNLGKKFGAGTWTASQTTKEGFGDDLVEIQKAAGTWQKAQHSDIMITMQREKEVPDSNIIRALFGKNRNDVTGGVIEIETDYSRAMFSKGAKFGTT